MHLSGLILTGTRGDRVESCLPPAFLPGFPGRLTALFRACFHGATVSETTQSSHQYLPLFCLLWQHNQKQWCHCKQQGYAMHSRLQRTKCTLFLRPDLPPGAICSSIRPQLPLALFSGWVRQGEQSSQEIRSLLQKEWGHKLWQSRGVRVFLPLLCRSLSPSPMALWDHACLRLSLPWRILPIIG